MCGFVVWLCECVWVCVCVLCVVVSFVALVEIVFVSLCLAQPPIIISMGALQWGWRSIRSDLPASPHVCLVVLVVWVVFVAWCVLFGLVVLAVCLGCLSWFLCWWAVLVGCLSAWVVCLWLCRVAGVRLCLLPCVGESSPVAFSSASVVSSPCLFASMLFPSWPAVHMHLQ